MNRRRVRTLHKRFGCGPGRVGVRGPSPGVAELRGRGHLACLAPFSVSHVTVLGRARGALRWKSCSNGGERHTGQDTTRDGGEVVQLAQRDREAHHQDDVADARDVKAKAADHDTDVRDRSAERRDATAEARDAETWSATHQHPAGSGERRRARNDREDAANDREQSVNDRSRARRDRKTSQQHRERASGDRGAAWEALAALRLLINDAEDNAEDMLLIGRAQGFIMQERGLPPTQALLDLCMQASQNDKSLADASHDIATDLQPPPP
jgi:hypothetical protein